MSAITPLFACCHLNIMCLTVTVQLVICFLCVVETLSWRLAVVQLFRCDRSIELTVIGNAAVFHVTDHHRSVDLKVDRN